MPTAWFIANVKRRTFLNRPTLYVAADDFASTFAADPGSAWQAIYCGPACMKAVVKVKASSSTIQTLAASADVVRIPLALLDNTIGSLTAAQQTAVQNQLLGMGYTQAQINAALPVLANATLRQVLVFACSTRGRLRYDQPSDSFVADQGSESCENPNDLDLAVA